MQSIYQQVVTAELITNLYDIKVIRHDTKVIRLKHKVRPLS